MGMSVLEASLLTLAAWGYSKISHSMVILDPHLAQLTLSGVWAPEVTEVIRLGAQDLTDQATRGPTNYATGWTDVNRRPSEQPGLS